MTMHLDRVALTARNHSWKKAGLLALVNLEGLAFPAECYILYATLRVVTLSVHVLPGHSCLDRAFLAS